MSIYIYPKFKYSPFLLSKADLKIKLDLEDLGLKEGDIDGFADNHLDKSFVFDYIYNHYDFFSDIEMMKQWNEKYLKAFPNSINAKINSINISDIEQEETTDLFKSVLSKEIDLLFNEEHSDVILNDEDYNSLLFFLTDSFCEIGEIENAKKIFRYVLSFGNQNTIEELAFRINGTKLDDFMQFNYVSFLMLAKKEIFDWQEEMLSYFYDKRKDLLPHNNFAYTILNKDTLYFSSSDIEKLNEYDNDELLYNDLSWVMYNGLARQFTGEDFFQEHYVHNTLLVAAHFKLVIFLDDFLMLLSNMPLKKEESLFGNSFNSLCAPSLVILGCHNISPIIKAYELKDHNYEYFIKMILNISQLNVAESENAKQFISKTLNELVSQGNRNLLQEWIYEIAQNNFSEYYWLIDQAKNEGWIDSVALELSADGDSEFDFYLSGKNNIDEITIDILLNYFHIVNRKNNPLQVDLDGIIDNIVMITNDRIIDSDFIERVRNSEFSTTTIDSISDAEIGGILGHKSESIKQEQPKVGRNSPCPCGSGRKYKTCCLSNN